MIPRIAVAGIAFDKDGKVLLARRGQPPREGLWSVPGGKVELGETLAQACAREMLEETGLEVDIGPRVALIERIGRENAAITHHYVIVDFLVQVRSGVARAASDVVEVGWFELSDLDTLPTTEGLAEVIHTARTLAAS